MTISPVGHMETLVLSFSGGKSTKSWNYLFQLYLRCLQMYNFWIICSSLMLHVSYIIVLMLPPPPRTGKTFQAFIPITGLLKIVKCVSNFPVFSWLNIFSCLTAVSFSFCVCKFPFPDRFTVSSAFLRIHQKFCFPWTPNKLDMMIS